MQLFGRAGRNGAQSRAHLFYSKQKKKVDAEIKDFCSNKENCLRRSLLKAIGDIHVVSVETSANPCCGNCPPSSLTLPSKVNLIESVPIHTKSKKRSAHWKTNKTLDETLKSRLLEERKKYVYDHQWRS